MKTRALTALLLSAATLAIAEEKTAAPEVLPTPEDQRIALVELYTSQGCSSCPSAEPILGGLERPEDVKTGKSRVVRLAFHVDYWDYLGWKDPFASGVFSKRQKETTARIKTQTYTPQILVDGKDAAGDAARAVAKSLEQTPLVRIHLTAEWDKKKPGVLRCRAEARPQAGTKWNRKALQLRMVLFENGLSTKVPAGENAGKTLEENFVVRLLPAPTDWKADQASVSQDCGVDTFGWKEARCGLAAFVQDPETLEVLQAAQIPLPAYDDKK